MSFSSSTALTLSGGGGAPSGGGGQPPASQSPATDPAAYNRPAPHRRVRSRPSGATASGQHNSYGAVPAGGQDYGHPRAATGTGTVNLGQSYEPQQNVNQSYGGQNVDYGGQNVDYGGQNVNYGGQNVSYGSPNVSQVTYDSPDAGQGYGQPYTAPPAQPNLDQSYVSQSTPPLQTYGQTYGGTPQPVGRTSGAPTGTGSGYGYQEQPEVAPSQSMEISNQGYKKPGAGQAPTPLVTSNIQTLSAATMALPPEVLASYRRKFDHMDLNKDGVVTMREFMAVSRVFGYKLTKDELAQIFGKRDLDESGGVTFDEFVTAMQERQRKNKDLQPVRQQFRMFDVTSRGYLTADDLAPRLERELGFDESKAEGFFDLFDKNKDYRISHLEFVDFYAAYTKLKAEIQQAFRDFDRNGDGYVDIYELNSKLAPKGFNEEEVETLMKKYDKDMDNRLNYQEFAAFWDVPII